MKSYAPYTKKVLPVLVAGLFVAVLSGGAGCKNVVEEQCFKVCHMFADCTAKIQNLPVNGPLRGKLVEDCMTPCTNYHQEMLGCYEEFEGSCQKMALCITNSGVLF